MTVKAPNGRIVPNVACGQEPWSPDNCGYPSADIGYPDRCGVED
jgi:hypothetical protein